MSVSTGRHLSLPKVDSFWFLEVSTAFVSRGIAMSIRTLGRKVTISIRLGDHILLRRLCPVEFCIESRQD